MLLHVPDQRYKRLKIKHGQNDRSGNCRDKVIINYNRILSFDALHTLFNANFEFIYLNTFLAKCNDSNQLVRPLSVLHLDFYC